MSIDKESREQRQEEEEDEEEEDGEKEGEKGTTHNALGPPSQPVLRKMPYSLLSDDSSLCLLDLKLTSTRVSRARHP